MEEYYLLALLHMSSSACFVIESRAKSPGLVPPVMSWVLFHQSLIKKLPYRLTYRPVLRRCFLNSLLWSEALSSDDYSMCQDCMKLSSTMTIYTNVVKITKRYYSIIRCYRMKNKNGQLWNGHDIYKKVDVYFWGILMQPWSFFPHAR